MPLVLTISTGMALVSSSRDSRLEEHTSELQSLMRISYAVFCLKKTSRPHRSTRPDTSVPATPLCQLQHIERGNPTCRHGHGRRNVHDPSSALIRAINSSSRGGLTM